MAHAVDIHVGKRLRHRRWMVGMTQAELAEGLGVRFQQVQKYEAGANRISASRLWDIAQALVVPVGYFFDGLDTGTQGDPHTLPDTLTEAEALLRFYRTMPPEKRRRLRALAQDFHDEVASAS